MYDAFEKSVVWRLSIGLTDEIEDDVEDMERAGEGELKSEIMDKVFRRGLESDVKFNVELL